MKSKVSIILGSDSDLDIMKECFCMLEKLKIEYELNIISAHRTQDYLINYLKNMDKNVGVIIAAAGGAAHLPGVIAANVLCPVIGVPIYTKTLNGIDSLYSIVQMPSGIPVATVSINGSKNAAILAAEILSIGDKTIKENLILYRKELENSVKEKNEKIHNIGWNKYLEEMK